MHNSMFSNPNFTRVSLGYGPMFRILEGFETDEALQGNKYPPHNIIGLDDEHFLVELAVAGFKRDEITVTHHKGVLTVSGKQEDKEAVHGISDELRADMKQFHGVDAETEVKKLFPQLGYIHRGISTREFQKTFNTAEYVVVTGAAYEDGIFNIAV
jgi:molecular chaperone IbpA